HINPYLGKIPVREITRRDVAKRHHEMAATPYIANRMLAVLSSVFSWADSHGLCPEGFRPTRGIKHYREARHERYLSAAELARLGDALREDRVSSPWAIAAIKLLALTGARKSEILTLRWDYVDTERGLLRLPGSKTGQKTIRLNAPALAELQSIPRLADNPFVICGYRGKPLMKLESIWGRIRKAARLDDVRLHDLRHSFASVGAAGGQSLLVIGKLLGHAHSRTTERYAHLGSDPLKAANDAIGGTIAAAMDGGVSNIKAMKTR